MASQKRNWFWNLILVITIVLCVSALTVHYKNWVKTAPYHIRLLSRFYVENVAYSDLDSVIFVERIPPMIRLNGFSALEKEKGIFQEFKDSLTDKKIHVFVDNISQPKIKLVYKDSLKLYFNLKDSLETDVIFNQLQEQIGRNSIPN